MSKFKEFNSTVTDKNNKPKSNNKSGVQRKSNNRITFKLRQDTDQYYPNSTSSLMQINRNKSESFKFDESIQFTKIKSKNNHNGRSDERSSMLLDNKCLLNSFTSNKKRTLSNENRESI